MSCQATDEDIKNETREREKEREKEREREKEKETKKEKEKEKEKDKAETVNLNQNLSVPPWQQTAQTNILQNYVPIRPAPPKEVVNTFTSSQTGTMSLTVQRTKQSDVSISPLSPIKSPPPIYKTLKPPVGSGEPFLPERVAVMSSPPSLPVQQTLPNLELQTGTPPLTSPVNSRFVMYTRTWLFEDSITPLLNLMSCTHLHVLCYKFLCPFDFQLYLFFAGLLRNQNNINKKPKQHH